MTLVSFSSVFRAIFIPKLAFNKSCFIHSPNLVRMASSSARINILDLLSVSVSAADQAGRQVREVMKKGDLGIVDKGINDLQTEADRSAQRIIVKAITSKFPEITVIGEETLEESDDTPDVETQSNAINAKELPSCPSALQSIPVTDIVVWVDPLDGTSEFAEGLLLDHVTVLIGISVSGKAVAGVINQPYYDFKALGMENVTGRTIWGCIGMGVFGLKESEKEVPDGRFIVTTTRSHYNKEIEASLKAMNPDEVLRAGGAGNKVLFVIEGKADAYVFPSSGCKKWDTCAPEAILRAKGGILTDILGRDITYEKTVQHINSSGVLATRDEKTHDKCLSLIPQDVKIKLMGHSLL